MQHNHSNPPFHDKHPLVLHTHGAHPQVVSSHLAPPPLMQPLLGSSRMGNNADDARAVAQICCILCELFRCMVQSQLCRENPVLGCFLFGGLVLVLIAGGIAHAFLPSVSTETAMGVGAAGLLVIFSVASIACTQCGRKLVSTCCSGLCQCCVETVQGIGNEVSNAVGGGSSSTKPYGSVDHSAAPSPSQVAKAAWDVKAGRWASPQHEALRSPKASVRASHPSLSSHTPMEQMVPFLVARIAAVCKQEDRHELFNMMTSLGSAPERLPPSEVKAALPADIVALMMMPPSTGSGKPGDAAPVPGVGLKGVGCFTSEALIFALEDLRYYVNVRSEEYRQQLPLRLATLNLLKGQVKEALPKAREQCIWTREVAAYYSRLLRQLQQVAPALPEGSQVSAAQGHALPELEEEYCYSMGKAEALIEAAEEEREAPAGGGAAGGAAAAASSDSPVVIAVAPSAPAAGGAGAADVAPASTATAAAGASAGSADEEVPTAVTSKTAAAPAAAATAAPPAPAGGAGASAPSLAAAPSATAEEDPSASGAIDVVVAKGKEE